ncbi:uncharacterized protein LOC127871974 isoform X2 [Dreissena polymorpha]|nr:uncharacterized protein LOC127871974 isoform X2 [Dreissena polymorpha]XP_052271254.1 uncharacterized protein LOC127871974 isoform X2 [Dreissena polymorpha]
MAGAHGDADNLEKRQEACAFSPAEKMRFTSLTYKIIEELKMRREIDSENEKKIQRLLQDRFTLGWKLDQENKKLKSSEEKHDAELRDVRRQLQEEMKEYQVEASQHKVYRQLAEKEREAMKEEIRKLQLVNYALDKKVREYERQEKLHNTDREQHIEQVSKYERLFKQVQSLGNTLECRQEQIEAKMKYLQDLTTKLQYETKHQTCILQLKDEEMECLRKQLLESQVKAKLYPVYNEGERSGFQEQITMLHTRITSLDKQNERMEKEGEDWKQKYWGSLKTLDEAHRLVNVHLHNAAAFKDECRAMEAERDGLKLELHQTRDRLLALEQRLNEAQERLEEEKQNWQRQEETLKENITDVKDKLSEVAGEKADIESQLNVLKDDLKRAKEELEAAQTILDVEKLSCEIQTELTMLSVMNRGVQALTEESEKSVQATVASRPGVSQTIDAALTSSSVQTDALEEDIVDMATVSCQTDLPDMEEDTVDMVTVSCQADLPDNKDVDAQCRDGEIEESKTLGKDVASVCTQTDFSYTGPVSGLVPSCAGTEEIDFGKSSFWEIMQNRNKCSDKMDISKDVSAELTDVNIQKKTLAERSVGNLETTSTVSDENLPTYTALIEDNNEENAAPAKVTMMLNNGQNFNIKAIGLDIPKIDVKTVKYAKTVFIEPDEFSIKLTQDEVNEIGEDETRKSTTDINKQTIKDENMTYVKYKSPAASTGNINFVDISNGSSQEDDEVAEILGDDEEDLEAAVEQKWALATDASKRLTKVGKHKLLSAQDVQEKFLEFEDRKKTFEALMQASIGQEAVPHKLQKVDNHSNGECDEPLRDMMYLAADRNIDPVKRSITGQITQKEDDNAASVLSADSGAYVVNTNSEKTETTRNSNETTILTGNSSVVKPAPSFLQTYRNLMAKIHPLPLHTVQFKRKADEADFGSDTKRTHVVSPKPSSAKGILKGAAGGKNKTKSITWSETVMMKDFYKEDNE